MSEYAGPTTYHTKRRGKLRHCSWCGQKIVMSERYGKWLWFDGGERSTVYAHEECCKAWSEESIKERGIVYADGDAQRPEKLCKTTSHSD